MTAASLANFVSRASFGCVSPAGAPTPLSTSHLGEVGLLTAATPPYRYLSTAFLIWQVPGASGDGVPDGGRRTPQRRVAAARACHRTAACLSAAPPS